MNLLKGMLLFFMPGILFHSLYICKAPYLSKV